MVPPTANARGLTVNLNLLQDRLAHIPGNFTLYISSPSFERSDAQATVELMEMLWGDSSPVRCQLAENPSLEGVEIRLAKDGWWGPVTFLGTPSGYELEALIHALECWVQPCHTSLDPSYQKLVEEITVPMRTDLYVAPT